MTAAFGANVAHGYSLVTSRTGDVIGTENGTEDDFTAVIRATCIPAEDCHQGLQEFQVTLRDYCIAYQGWQLSAVSGLNRASV